MGEIRISDLFAEPLEEVFRSPKDHAGSLVFVILTEDSGFLVDFAREIALRIRDEKAFLRHLPFEKT